MALKTLENSLELLKYFTKDNPTWGVRELAKEMNINHTIVYRILSTFEQYGFLIQDTESKKYELGLKLWEYGHLVEDRLGIADRIRPIMRKISEQIGESIFLTWLDGLELECVCVEIAESQKNIKFAVSVGSRTPLYAGASNKMIMAYLSPMIQERVIEKGLRSFTDRTLVDAKKLRTSLHEIRRDEWCYSIGEFAENVFGLAVPLFNKKKEVIASLTIAGPGYRAPNENLADVMASLQQGQAEIQEFVTKYSLRYLD